LRPPEAADKIEVRRHAITDLGPAPVRTLILLLALSTTAAAQPAQRAILAERFRATLQRLASSSDAPLGAHVVDLTSGEKFGVNDTMVFPQGSAIKITVLVELYRRVGAGEMKLGDRILFKESDRTGGSGLLDQFMANGSELALRDLAMVMIRVSDNTATNMLIDHLGMERINATSAALGFADIKLQRKMIRPAESAKGNENIATAAGAAGLMVKIHRCELPMPRPQCDDLRAILEIPKNGALPASVPGNVKVAWKPGGITGVQTFWGIVDLPGRPYAIAAMANYGRDDMLDQEMRKVADAAYDYFRRLAGATPHGTRVPPGMLEK
jgi:beta-lactamase class A